MRVGMCLPISERLPERRAWSYDQMRELAMLSEAGGLDSVWVADHLLFESEGKPQRGAWESLSLLGGLAEATERVELGPLVLCTPFRNSGLIAWMANTLDEVSGGRFVLGLGCGWHEPEFRAFGFEFARRVSLFEESLNVLVPLLREGRVDFEGALTRGASQLRPPGPRRGGPPILIASSAPRMMRLTARHADRWNSVWYGLPCAESRRERAALVSACADEGRDPGEVEVSVGIVIREPSGGHEENSEEALVGAAEHIAAGLAAWRDEGVTEVMCRLEPPSIPLAEEIVRALQLFRAA